MSHQVHKEMVFTEKGERGKENGEGKKEKERKKIRIEKKRKKYEMVE